MVFNPFYSPNNPGYYPNTTPAYFQKGHGGYIPRSRDQDFWDEYSQPRRNYQQPNLKHGPLNEDIMDRYYQTKRRPQYQQQVPTPSSLQNLRDEFYRSRRPYQQPPQRQHLEQRLNPPPPRKQKVVPQQNIISIHDGTLEKSYQLNDGCTLEQLKEHLAKEYDLELSDYIELSHNSQILSPNESTLDDLKIGYGTKLKFSKTNEYYEDEKQINKINEYSKELESLEEKAKTLNLNEKDAMILDEQLTFLLQKIDSIETNGRCHIRSKRKSLVLRAQQASVEANKNKIIVPTITSPSQTNDQIEREITEVSDNLKQEDEVEEFPSEEIKKKNEEKKSEKEEEVNEIRSKESKLVEKEISQVVDNLINEVDKQQCSPLVINENENNEAFENLKISLTDDESLMEGEDDGINTECAVADDITEDVTDNDSDYDTDDNGDDIDTDEESAKEYIQNPFIQSTSQTTKRGRKRASMSPVDEDVLLTRLFNEDIEEDVDADNEEENDLTDNDESDLYDDDNSNNNEEENDQEICHNEKEKIFMKDIQCDGPKYFNKELLPSSSSDSRLAELLYNRYRQSNPDLPAWYTLVN